MQFYLVYVKILSLLWHFFFVGIDQIIEQICFLWRKTIWYIPITLSSLSLLSFSSALGEHYQGRQRYCKTFFAVTDITLNFWNIFDTQLETIVSLFKWTKSGLFLFIFVLFTFQFKWQVFNFNYTNWKKHRYWSWILTRGRRLVGTDDSTELWRVLIGSNETSKSCLFLGAFRWWQNKFYSIGPTYPQHTFLKFATSIK